MLDSGCGCPTIGTYGSSCDCQCNGQFYDGVPQPLSPENELLCPIYDQMTEECDYCPY